MFTILRRKRIPPALKGSAARTNDKAGQVSQTWHPIQNRDRFSNRGVTCTYTDCLKINCSEGGGEAPVAKFILVRHEILRVVYLLFLSFPILVKKIDRFSPKIFKCLLKNGMEPLFLHISTHKLGHVY
jgi:hypothetical protein